MGKKGGSRLPEAILKTSEKDHDSAENIFPKPGVVCLRVVRYSQLRHSASKLEDRAQAAIELAKESLAMGKAVTSSVSSRRAVDQLNGVQSALAAAEAYGTAAEQLATALQAAREAEATAREAAEVAAQELQAAKEAARAATAAEAALRKLSAARQTPVPAAAATAEASLRKLAATREEPMTVAEEPAALAEEPVAASSRALPCLVAGHCHVAAGNGAAREQVQRTRLLATLQSEGAPFVPRGERSKKRGHRDQHHGGAGSDTLPTSSGVTPSQGGGLKRPHSAISLQASAPCLNGAEGLQFLATAAELTGDTLTDDTPRALRASAGVLNHTCANCGTCGKTPQTRRGPAGNKTLCNACGARLLKGTFLDDSADAWATRYPVDHKIRVVYWPGQETRHCDMLARVEEVRAIAVLVRDHGYRFFYDRLDAAVKAERNLDAFIAQYGRGDAFESQEQRQQVVVAKQQQGETVPAVLAAFAVDAAAGQHSQVAVQPLQEQQQQQLLLPAQQPRMVLPLPQQA